MDKHPILHLQVDPNDYSNFCKKSKDEQIHELLAQGMHLDTMFDTDYKTLLFFLRGFFVEVTIARNAERVVEILPIKDGYKIEQFIYQIQNHFPGNPILS